MADQDEADSLEFAAAIMDRVERESAHPFSLVVSDARIQFLREAALVP